LPLSWNSWLERDDAAGAISRGDDPLHLAALDAVGRERSLDAAGGVRLLHLARRAAFAEQLALAPVAASYETRALATPLPL
jgi:hypothetical protein